MSSSQTSLTDRDNGPVWVGPGVAPRTVGVERCADVELLRSQLRLLVTLAGLCLQFAVRVQEGKRAGLARSLID